MPNKKIRRYKLMDAHRELVRSGKLEEGKRLLQLLRKGRVKLGLGDVDWKIESLCEEFGCHISYSRNGNTVEVII